MTVKRKINADATSNRSARRLSAAVVGYIQESRKQITILFTDIEDSTKYWDTHGDVEGRLMVDMHNRLTFPVIRKFRGKIIKTIGDSIMASFKRPEDAIQAAIGMQQILDQARRADKTFTLRVRIGVHTGLALVEKDDVFGDVVNVAARVEGQAKGNQILVSHGTATALDDFDFGFSHAGTFKPKGKSQLMTVHNCPWDDFESIIYDIKPGSYLPLVARQKVALSLYSISTLAIGYFLYIKYLRYIAADNKELALLILNPNLIIERYPIVLYALGVGLLGLATLFWRVHAAPNYALKTLAGGFGFALGFFMSWILAQYSPWQVLPWSHEILSTSKHLFVNIVANDTLVQELPNDESPTLLHVNSGDVLLQMDVKKHQGATWTKVYLGPEMFGWVTRLTPAQIGIPEIRRTVANKFRLRWADVHALVIGCIGFVVGYLRFRLRPV